MIPSDERTDDEIALERLLVFLDSKAYEINARFSPYHANISRSSSIPQLLILKK